MISTKTSILQRISLFLGLTIIIFSCKRTAEPVYTIDPEFTSYVSAFTSGQVSKESNIMIRLTSEYPEKITANEPFDDKLFKFQPGLSGTAYWIDQRTIKFVPDESLESGTLYKVEFDLDKVSEVPDHLRTFEFQFQTISQTFSVQLEPLKSYSSSDMKWHKLGGTLLTADIIEDEEIEKVLKARQKNNVLSISWTHGAEGKTHSFTIDSILRTEDEGSVIVSWDGNPVDVNLTGSETVTIPALGDFSMMSVSVVQHPEQYVRLVFSDPLQPSQYLEGLIRLENGSDLQFIIEENEIKAYPSVRQIGSLKVYVEAGIKNSLGYKLKGDNAYDVNFEEVKPAVRLLGNGVILPNSDGLIFPFEAVNLKAVEVRIIQIYESNIGQFLQINHLDGNSQLKRVGRLIHKKTINLTSGAPLDYGSWNTFSIDLAELIRARPGAIYRIEFSFRKKHSLYPCEEDEDTEDVAEEEIDYDESFEEELSYWDSYESYYSEYEGEYYYYYDWEEREDPCSDYYYGRHRNVARNILASDLGIIAKGGSDHSMTFAVCDLRTTEPLAGVEVEFYNYQQQLLGTTATNSEGLATADLAGKPFYLIAKNGEQRGYLRLDDGSSLSLSKFDVSGSVVRKGIKGYIYGERGVWRPGDTLYLTFMLEDKKNSLPPSHPVSFELINPMGQVISKMVKTTAQNGFYSFITSTSPDAPTGNWTARIKVGGTTFTKWLRIETVKPNRIKINLDFGTEKLSVSRPDIRGTIRANWLHGAIARNLRTQITVMLNQIKTQFSSYSDYIFDDPARTFYSEEQTIFDSRLDDQGKAGFSTDISVGSSAPGMLRAHFITRVFEESGEFSIDRYSIPYSPYTGFVGIKTPKGDKARGMLLTDTTHTVEIVTVDPDGNKISCSNLDCKVYKIHWRWWWDASYDNLASYIGSSQHSPLVSKKVNTRNGEGKFTFRIDYPEWGRYLIRVVDPESGHATGKIVYIDWPGWAGRAQREHPGGAAMLTFSADKQKYLVGETATLSIPTSGHGRALISIENGSRVIEAHWVEATEPETRFNLPVTDQMTPNVFVNVTLVQPHAQSVNDLPVRLYGVIPLAVEDPQTKLEPELKMPDVLEPEGAVTIQVSEKNGTECSYTVAMVDEGLLDLTRFRTPDPWSVFYAREALGVKTWDIYDMVLGAYGGKMEKIFSIGGGWEEDEGDGDGSQSKANRFPPMVRFIGPFTLKKGQSNSHTINIPRYIGSVKTMVVAGNQSAYGYTDKTTPVRKPLMVLATLPRVLGPNEEVKLPVTVFAMEDNLEEVDVTVEVNNLIEVVGDSKRVLHFREIGDKMTDFDLQVKPGLGIGKVTITARSGSRTAQYDIELDIRNPNPPVTEFIDTIVEPGETWETSFQLPGMAGTNSALLEVSNMPPIDFGRRLKYLTGYPHGCIEQITSGAFPQIFLGDVMDLDNKTVNKTEENIKAAIRSLNTFMLPGGGLSYWPGGQYVSDWGTSYAGHFMLEAETKGYNLPADFKKKWIRYQKKAAKQWRKSSEKYRQSDLSQAYRLYTLALSGSPDLGSMNRLREQQDLSVQSTWRLAAAYILAGQKDVASKMVANITTEVDAYSGFNYTYGSRERDWAMILETLTLLDQRAKGIDLVQKMSEQLSSKRWMSTQTIAYCLLSITRFAGSDATSKEMKYEFSLDKGGRPVNAATKMSLAQHEIEVKDLQAGHVLIKNKGDGVLFARVTMHGIPEAGDETAASNNLTLQVEYTDMKGYPIDPDGIIQGLDFLVHLIVSNPSGVENYRDMALTQIFPSGWEIHNTRMDDFTSVHQSSVPNYQDIRDDRVYTYFHLPRYEQKTFIIQLNAAYVGKYYLPTVYCEAMYDERVNARKPGKWIEVSKD